MRNDTFRADENAWAYDNANDNGASVEERDALLKLHFTGDNAILHSILR